MIISLIRALTLSVLTLKFCYGITYAQSTVLEPPSTELPSIELPDGRIVTFEQIEKEVSCDIETVELESCKLFVKAGYVFFNQTADIKYLKSVRRASNRLCRRENASFCSVAGRIDYHIFNERAEGLHSLQEARRHFQDGCEFGDDDSCKSASALQGNLWALFGASATPIPTDIITELAIDSLKTNEIHQGLPNATILEMQTVREIANFKISGESCGTGGKKLLIPDAGSLNRDLHARNINWIHECMRQIFSRDFNGLRRLVQPMGIEMSWTGGYLGPTQGAEVNGSKMGLEEVNVDCDDFTGCRLILDSLSEMNKRQECLMFRRSALRKWFATTYDDETVLFSPTLSAVRHACNGVRFNG